MGKRLTIEHYEALAASRGFEWLGERVPTTQTKTRWRCQYGHEWEAKYSNILHGGNGCPQCAALAKRLRVEDYEALAKVRGLRWVGVELVSTRMKTKWECPCGHKWEAEYNGIQQGGGCPRCAPQAPKRPNDYRALAQSKGFEWLGPEVPNNATKTKWRCQYGHEWKAGYGNIKQGCGCPHCAGNGSKKPSDYFALAQSRGFEWLGPEVSNSETRTGWRCQRGHEWEAVYGSIRRGSGCPACNTSRGEDAIACCLDRIGISYKRERWFRSCKGSGGRTLPFDFSFHYHTTTFLVEYDGRQHYEANDFFGGEAAFQVRQKHDAIKTKFAADNGYILIRIPYTVEQIDTYLIEEIARRTGLTFEQVAFPSQQTRPSVNLSEAPPVGLQLPLLVYNGEQKTGVHADRWIFKR